MRYDVKDLNSFPTVSVRVPVVSTTKWVTKCGFECRRLWSRRDLELVPGVSGVEQTVTLNKSQVPVKSVGHHSVLSPRRTTPSSKERPGPEQIYEGDTLDRLKISHDSRWHYPTVTQGYVSGCECSETKRVRVSKRETWLYGTQTTCPPHPFLFDRKDRGS